MPCHSHALLTRWVADFVRTTPISSTIEVLHQDGFDGEDGGLVVVRPRGVDAEFYLLPAAPGESRFVVTIAALANEVTIDSLQLLLLSEELKNASALCDHLESRSRAMTMTTGEAGGGITALRER